MPEEYLTKTDFLLGEECPTKLYYAKHADQYTRIPTDSYHKFLAEDGHRIQKIAELLHPGGTRIGQRFDHTAAVEQTRQALQSKQVILYEAAAMADQLLAYTDILIKKDRTLELIEVKSTSFDGSDPCPFRTSRGVLRSGWRPYLQDVAFQVLVLRAAFPDLQVIPHTLLPDLTKSVVREGLAGQFEIVPAPPGQLGSCVEFRGDPEAVRESNFLTQINVTEEVEELLPEVKNAVKDHLQGISTRRQGELGSLCKGCQFRDNEHTKRSGFHECWGTLAAPKPGPHILELYHGGTVKVGGEPLFTRMVREGTSSLLSIPLDALSGKRGKRQRLQIEMTRAQQEYFDPELETVLESFTYPLQFIDFETIITAIPLEAGQSPFELMAFQWSCHTITAPGEEPVHSEWLNTERRQPSFAFAEALCDQLEETGSVFMWATHEQTVLRTIRRLMEKYEYDNAQLGEWIDGLAGTQPGESQLIDMAKLINDHYFHPRLGGSVSLKYVLPTVWEAGTALHQLAWFKPYVRKHGGCVADPYETLPPLQVSGSTEVVREGTSAMIAYQEMLYSADSDDPELKAAWSTLLRQYCKLDTLAMVAVWTYLRGHFGLRW